MKVVKALGWLTRDKEEYQSINRRNIQPTQVYNVLVATDRKNEREREKEKGVGGRQRQKKRKKKKNREENRETGRQTDRDRKTVTEREKVVG